MHIRTHNALFWYVVYLAIQTNLMSLNCGRDCVSRLKNSTACLNLGLVKLIVMINNTLRQCCSPKQFVSNGRSTESPRTDLGSATVCKFDVIKFYNLVAVL